MVRRQPRLTGADVELSFALNFAQASTERTLNHGDSYNSPNARVHLPNPNKFAGSGSCFPWMLDTMQAILKVTKKKQIRIV